MVFERGKPKGKLQCLVLLVDFSDNQQTTVTAQDEPPGAEPAKPAA